MQKEYEFEVERLAFGGMGVARNPEGMTVFVEDGLPGQRVRARLVRRRKRYLEARVTAVLHPSDDQVPPRCVHFGVCGGCRLQHLSYPAQLGAKTSQVREVLQRVGHIPDPPVEPALASPSEYGYRNKMEYSFGDRRWLTAGELAERLEQGQPPRRECVLGLHPRGRWDRVLPLRECHLPHPRSVEVLTRVQQATARSRHPAYTTRTHTGFWRFLTVRQGVRTDQWMVDLITADLPEAGGEVDALARHLAATCEWITTITHTISRSRAAVAAGEELRVLYGPGFIEEQIAGLHFRISPRSFFQTNTEGAERLYEEALKMADLQGGEQVWDIYSGTGTIALIMALRADKVYGFEIEPQAVIDARANAERNGLTRAHFVEGDVVRSLHPENPRGCPDVVVLDPPRAGLHPDVCARVPALGARRLIYVSCNPGTLARDLAVLCAAGYRLTVVQPIDLFPHTPHVESVCLLNRE